MTLKSGYAGAVRAIEAAGGRLQPALLLAVRLYWGWGFFQTGWGKLTNLERTTEFFAGLGLPWPAVNAALAGAVEAGGGLLLVAGLGARLASVPLAGTMLVAYATAHREELGQLFSAPDKVTEAAPFLFLLASLLVLAFGPGRWSADGWLARRRAGGAS